jgi:hypothetical protein
MAANNHLYESAIMKARHRWRNNGIESGGVASGVMAAWRNGGVMASWHGVCQPANRKWRHQCESENNQWLWLSAYRRNGGGGLNGGVIGSEIIRRKHQPRRKWRPVSASKANNGEMAAISGNMAKTISVSAKMAKKAAKRNENIISEKRQCQQ